MSIALKKKHDIVAIGASAGGVEALLTLVGGLPADFPAALLVVVHLAPDHESHLADLLKRAGPLPAHTARAGALIREGHILVAPRDRHLLVRFGVVDVERGPRENGHRPSVDALFRTAAATYGPRVIGVVLTGYQDCGTAGLLSIKARGGVAVVQDPSDAAARPMPESAIRHVRVDHVVPIAEMSALLERLARTEAGLRPSTLSLDVRRMEDGSIGGADAEVVCPSCQGKLIVSDVDGHTTFRCHIGHMFTLQTLPAEQGEEVERALWASVRALEEAAALSRRVANTMSGSMRDRLLEKEQTQRQQADVVRGIVLGGRYLGPREDDLVVVSEAEESPAAPQSHNRKPTAKMRRVRSR